ncbi:MAG TPA: lysylphosphatidylglycerol synthase transmembrane domain-containing protein [Candidatus Saccharimonadales bacterium]|nr:lysylphosphatidylglycerol synthase transmembrane domain-containing protein [Candidatus Saccharimonadales bacterium]
MPKNTKTAAVGGHYSGRIRMHTWLRLFVLGFLLYAVAAGFGDLQSSLSAVRQAEPWLLVLAAAAIALSYVFAATTIILLAVKKLPFLPTLSVQIAGGLVNRMLPAGLGGMGLNAFYLKKQKHPLPVASAIVATNNLLGFIGNILLIGMTALVMPLAPSQVQLPHVPLPVIAGVVAVLTVAVIIFARLHGARRKIRQFLTDVGRYGRALAARPLRSLLALASSGMLTALHALGLLLVLQAVGGPAQWSLALLAISVGAFAGAAVPTPGGLGGAEAGIATTLVAFAVPLELAVTAALVYRGLTYWLPLLPGYVALRIVEKRYL